MTRPLKRIYDPSAFDPAKPVGSWWEDSAPPTRNDFSPLPDSRRCDVAIIGAGFTGLNAALGLVRDHGLDVCVVDAGYPGFGASGRNGGFCCIPAAKLELDEMTDRFGLDETRRFFRAQIDATEHVGQVLDTLDIEADVHSRGGELGLAHSADAFEELAEEADILRDLAGVAPRIVPRAELRQIGADGPEFHGGLILPIGFGLNPMKYLRGLADSVADAGAAIHGQTEVRGLRLKDGAHTLVTPRGEITARHVIVATNGYTAETVPDWLGGRLLPVLSNILVTRPLTEDELDAQGWTTDFMCGDTRTLLHYFRLMPDRRFLFGGRAGVSAKGDDLDRHHGRLRADFDRMFPAWADVEDTHRWSGFVCLTRNLTPFVGRIPGFETAWAGLAFHGNGVATGSWSGARLAELVAGTTAETDLPAVFRNPPARFPLPFLRPLYLHAAYALYGWQDGR